MTSAKSAKKAPKRKEEIIRAAAEVMRKKGVLTTRLNDVADYLGILYTALYHYFPSRDHLAEEVLLWTMAGRHSLLTDAAGDSGLAKLLNFFERALTEGRIVQVHVPLLFGLPEPHRKSVTKARNVLRDAIVSVLEEGIEDGSIRPCDSLTVANTLLVILERFSVFDQWLFSDTVRNVPFADVVGQLCAALRSGILQSNEPPPRESWCIERGEELLSYGPNLTPALSRIDELLRTATKHFNHEGADASVPRMAEELGVSKTTIYQYVIDKQDLLFQCYLRGVSVSETSHRLAQQFATDPLDATLIHRHNLYLFHSGPVGPFTFLNSMNALKPQHRRLISARNQGLRSVSLRRLSEAQAAGIIKPGVNIDIIQPMFAQMLYGLPGWYSGTYHLGIEEVCWQTGLIPLLGLERR